MMGNEFGNKGPCRPFPLQFLDDAGVGRTSLRLHHRFISGAQQQRVSKLETNFAIVVI